MTTKGSTRRIVMVGTHFDTMGGISSVVRGYAEAGLLDRHAIRYVVVHRDGTSLQKLLTALQGIARLLWICASERHLLVHIHLSSRASFWRKSLCCLSCLTFRQPYLLHVHGSEFMRFFRDECGPMAQRMVRFVLSHAVCLLALSESWRADLRTITADTPIEVLPNAVPLPEHRSHHAGQPPGQPRTILFLGRLGPRKGTDDLVHAFAAIAAEFPDIALVCAGDGEIDATLQTAADLGLETRVSCPGWLRGEDKQAALARAVIFALPSHAEGLPMALLEAMAAGLPVVATRVGGIPEVVRHEVEGHLVPPGDVAEIAQSLRLLLRDEPLRTRLGANARCRIEDGYALPRVIERLETIYRSVS